jgi:hypothetical protein
MKPAALLSTLFLGFIAVAHLARLALALPITVDDVAVPVWLSAPAAIATAALAIWLWREQQPVGNGW